MHGTPGSVPSADGTRIGFLTAGTGPALLLVHGGMCGLQRWAPLWPLLTGHFQVTAMDRRGRGRSGDGRAYRIEEEFADVVAVAELLASRQGSPVDLFGHSFGALCALGAAAMGASAKRAVLYEPPGAETVPLPWLDRMRKLLDRGEPGRAMFSFLTEVVGLTVPEVETLRKQASGPDPLPVVQRTLVREAEALLATDPGVLAGDVRLPVLLLLGSTSPPWAATVTRGLADRLPDVRVADLPGQGHEALETAPGLVADLTLDFLLPDRRRA